MAVTRIKNNQITDSTVTGSKLVEKTITSGLLADNLTYASNLIISGNLTVNGTTTTVDATNTLIADPLLVLSRGETGSPSADSGFVVERGTSTNVAFIWDESEDVFALVNTTEDGDTAGDIAISSYADLTVANLVAADVDFGNIRISGNTISSTDTNGDINLTPDGSGEVVAATLTVSDLTDNRVLLAGTSGAVEDSANLTFDGSTLVVTGTANISTNLNVSGEATLASATISDLTDNRVLLAGTAGAVEDSANLTFDGTTLTVTGNAAIDNITIDSNTVSTSSGNLTLDSTGGETSINDNLTVTGTLDVTGATNLNDTTGSSSTSTGALVVDGGVGIAENVHIGGTLDAGETTLASATISDLTDNRVLLAGTSGAVEDSANLTFDGTTLTVTGNLTVDNITIDGDTISSVHNTITIDPSTAGVGGTVVVAGNLEVTGTTTTVDSTVVTIADPVFQLGENSTDDNLDRGIKALYNNSGAKIAFFGMDDTNQEFVYIPDATDTSSVFSGSLGGAAFGSLRVVDLTDNRVLIAGASGEVEDSANLTFDGSTLVVTGTANISTDLNVSGEATLASATVSDLTDNRVVVAGTSGALEDSANLTFDGTTLTVTGDVAVDNVTVDGNTVSTSAGNLTLDSTSGETTISDNLTVTGTLDVTGATNLNDTTGSSSTSTGALIVDGGVGIAENVHIGGTLDAGETTLSSATVSDLTDNRVVVAGTSGALEDSANLTFDGTTLTVTGNLVVDNITVDGDAITSSNALTIDAAASQSIVVNEAGNDVDIRFEASGEANAFYIEGSTGNIGLRTATPTTDAILTMNSTDSFIGPVGTTLERPGTPVTGMLRFNTTTDVYEFYDGTQWVNSGSNFTIAVADDFSGDGSTVAFTLSESSTSASTLVSINGIVQDPGTAYSISGTTLTFTEAPAEGDSIDARILTTTETVTALADLNTTLTVDDTTETITNTVDGDVIMTVTNAAVVPGANVTYDLGTSSLRWKDLYLSGTTLALGDLKLKDNGSGVLGIFESDGTTPATISNSSSITLTANNSTDETVYLTFADGATGSQELETDTGLTYNPSTNTLTTTNFDGESTTAKYADLAENYTADADYEPGTVVCFGGEAEVTVCTHDADRRVAGVVSTAPAHLMNSMLEAEHVVALALQGRVPCRVVGEVAPGDLMVSAGNGAARAEADPKVGTVIGKALETHAGGVGVIEVAVGRF